MQKNIDIIKVNTGIYWVNIPAAHLKILCGCPADTVKHLKKRGLIDLAEKDGVRFETGPNAILLSDISLQNGALSNLAEFPILQMLYSQGMLLPNHPNNNGTKPLLIGSEQQVKAQMEYFYRGNYGLISKEEMMATGVSEEQADELMHIKLRFAFGKLKSSDMLVDKVLVEEVPVEVKENVFIKRKDHNIFEISYHREKVVVDLNLKSKENYEPPYYLGFHKLNREYFSVVHTGEGDAWDVNRPCMASIVMFQGKIYLVDAGPDLLASLEALGVTINEVAGIFNTHAHDDHFAGLVSFVRSDHRIKYFASPLVRASVAKKLCALMSLEEESFDCFFDVHDLQLDEWNYIEGLEVKPILSPHPVETNIFYFRTFWGSRYYTYAHLADICSFRVLKDNICRDDGGKNYNHLIEKTKRDYLLPADLKKIDIGGGLIHGDAQDFVKDTTPKILLAHISRPLVNEEKQVGSFAPFGSVDSLAETHYDFLRGFAYQYLKFYFPDVPHYEINVLLNCPMISMNAGDTLFRKGIRYDHVYLLLTGAVEMVYPETGIENNLSAGSLIGFYIDDNDITTKATCRASCYITALKIPSDLYLVFVKRHQLVEPFNVLEARVINLANTWLFSENISLPVYIKIAQILKKRIFKKGDSLKITHETMFFIIKKGKVALLTKEGAVIENLKKGDFYGAENRLTQKYHNFEVFFLEETETYEIPMEKVLNIPIVYWKLLHTAQQRIVTLY